MVAFHEESISSEVKPKPKNSSNFPALLMYVGIFVGAAGVGAQDRKDSAPKNYIEWISTLRIPLAPWCKYLFWLQSTREEFTYNNSETSRQKSTLSSRSPYNVLTWWTVHWNWSSASNRWWLRSMFTFRQNCNLTWTDYILTWLWFTILMLLLSCLE